ncbi:MAG: alpha/beta hydrolase [Bacteroidota bacterium]
MKTNQVSYQQTIVNDLNIFYRSAGPVEAPVILLLHGYPTSSFMFRNLIPILSERFRVIAPDLPGFGFSESPSREVFDYTFDHLANVMDGFVKKLKLERFAIYIFDYGAPVGLRLALANPEKITGIISQNGNAYEEGLSNEWNPLRKYWVKPTLENREALREFMAIHITRFQYEHGVSDTSLISPDTYTLDQYFLDKPGHIDIQLDLILDYRTNVALYPKFQYYFRTQKPPILAVWGNNDPYFLPAGAKGFQKDNPDATVIFYDTGHFALETHAAEIGQDVLTFLDQINQ